MANTKRILALAKALGGPNSMTTERTRTMTPAELFLRAHGIGPKSELISNEELAEEIFAMEQEDKDALERGQSHGNYGEQYRAVALDLRDARACNAFLWAEIERVRIDFSKAMARRKGHRGLERSVLRAAEEWARYYIHGDDVSPLSLSPDDRLAYAIRAWQFGMGIRDKK